MGRACRVKERSDWQRICKICVLAENHLHGFTCSVFAVRRLGVGFMDFSVKYPCGGGDE